MECVKTGQKNKIVRNNIRGEKQHQRNEQRRGKEGGGMNDQRMLRSEGGDETQGDDGVTGVYC